MKTIRHFYPVILFSLFSCCVWSAAQALPAKPGKVVAQAAAADATAKEATNASTPVVPPKPVTPKRPWPEALLANLKSLEAANPDAHVGLYIKSLKTGKELSYRGDEFWYIASEVKVPVALEVLRAIDAGTLTFETKVEVLDTDYIDGAGEMNYIKPGSKVSVRMLLDQALTFSDNTATDMLIRVVGIDKVNALTSSLVPADFTPITTLADVRRHAYSEFHPGAEKLSNAEFIKIKVAKEENAKLDLLAKLLKVKRSEFRHSTFDAAFDAYYAKRLNSSTLRGFGTLLEKIHHGTILKPATRRHLMDLLERIATGDHRIKAGLPSSYTFAHKTGTQHKRFCDMGILRTGSRRVGDFIVASCVRNVPLEPAETLFRNIGEAIQDSGVFAREPK